MRRRRPLALLLYLNVVLLCFLVGYKAYLYIAEPDVEALHETQLVRLEQRLADRDRLRLAVVGNINNSIAVFENRILPMLNRSDADLVVSAGNAVSGGGEDKYRALLGTLSHLDRPYLLTFGENEYEDFGSFRFYQRFGPHFFSVAVGGTRLVFLDSTGKTPRRWQERWFDDLMAGDTSRRVLVFMGHSLVEPEQDVLFPSDGGAWEAEQDKRRLMNLFERHGVDAVFSADVATFSDVTREGVRYVTTGGAGGFVMHNDVSFYHYVDVVAGPEGMQVDPVRLDLSASPLMSRLESAWFFVYSLFYVSFVNFLLIFSALLLITVQLYRYLFRERDYYPDFDIRPAPWVGKPLRVAMFTNNYLPFVGGVPVSIDRLRRGLRRLGHTPLIVAPSYPEASEDSDAVLRVRALVPWGLGREFKIANVFSRRIRQRVRAFRPDVIHLHHPFWMGSLGLFLARRLGAPTVYTYHTRLEHYAHFIPFPGRLFRNVISHWLVERFANKCSVVIVPTAAAKEYMRIIGVRTPIFVQPSGIDFEVFQQVREDDVTALRRELGIGDARVMVSASRLSPEKNIDFMIRAVARLDERLDAPFRLLILGEGGDHRRLQALIEAHGLGDRVTLVGSVPPERMPVYYALGDLFVFASKSETQGMVVLEAMAAGLPVVAVDSSGIDDFVVNGRNGYKTREDIVEWRDAVARLLGDDAARRDMSEQARNFARSHALEAFGRAVSGIYASALELERREVSASTRAARR